MLAVMFLISKLLINEIIVKHMYPDEGLDQEIQVQKILEQRSILHKLKRQDPKKDYHIKENENLKIFSSCLQMLVVLKYSSVGY